MSTECFGQTVTMVRVSRLKNRAAFIRGYRPTDINREVSATRMEYNVITCTRWDSANLGLPHRNGRPRPKRGLYEYNALQQARLPPAPW